MIALLDLGAEAAEALLLDDAQQLGLGADRHLADLVEQQRAFLCQLEAAGAALDGAGEGALFVAEDLRFDQGLRDGGAVDGDKGLGLARAQLVQGAGDELPCRCRFRR